MTKKIVAVLLAFGLTFSLMACGSSAGTQTGASGGTDEAQEEPAEETDVQEAQDEAQPESEGQETAGDVAEAVEDGAQGADLTGKKVGFSALMMSSEFFTDMSNQMEAYFTEHGMEYSVADANGNAQTQIQTVENFVSMGMDYIICFVVDASSISDSLIKAREGGGETENGNGDSL